jgi:SNF2 family DNA or RNA helicase
VSTFDYYIINYDIIKNYHSTDKSEDSDDYKLLVNAGFELAIVDEAHYISNTTANRTRLLNDVLDQIPNVWLLTGTPMTSRPINYFNLLKIVDSPLRDIVKVSNLELVIEKYGTPVVQVT